MKTNRRLFNVFSIAVMCEIVLLRLPVIAEGIDHLVPDYSGIFSNQKDLATEERIRKALRLQNENVPQERDAIVEIVNGKDSGESMDWVLILDRPTEESKPRHLFELEMRIASDKEGAAPVSWRIAIEKDLAQLFHRIVVKAVQDAHYPSPDKTLALTAQWYRCHDNNVQSRTAVVPAFMAPGGRLQAMSLAVTFAARWVRSEGKDEEMKRRFRQELEKIDTR